MTITKQFPTITFAKLSILVLTLCVLCGKSPAQDFKQLHPGVEYAQVEHKLGSEPVNINLLRLDLRKVRLDVLHAMDTAIGMEKTSSIARRNGAIAAINAGFFRLDTSIYGGEAAGILQIDGTLLSESVNDRAAVFFVNRGLATEVYFGNPKTGRVVIVGNSTFKID